MQVPEFNLRLLTTVLGINIRHLGFVLALVRNPYIRMTILCEMIARILKDGLNARLRMTCRAVS